MGHKKHHRIDETGLTSSDHIIDVDLHLLGGFNDQDGQSQELSIFLLNLFAQIAEEERHSIRFTLRTCAVSGLNDDGNHCPIGRGLGMNTESGQVFLVDIDRAVSGPALVIRAARLWSITAKKKLHVVHNVQPSHNNNNLDRKTTN